MAEKKVTKVEKFNAIAKVLADAGVSTLSIRNEEVNVAEFIGNEVALIEKKASKATTKRVDNSEGIAKVREVLADGKAYTPTEIQALTGLVNTQKVASVLKAMGDSVKRETKGKKVTYKLA